MITDFPIPTASLAIDGVAPDVGDTVEFTVTGTVAEASTERTFVTPTQVNGQPLPDEGPPHGDEDAGDSESELPTEEELRRAAEAYDNGSQTPFLGERLTGRSPSR